jgi:hypothetical protein
MWRGAFGEENIVEGRWGTKVPASRILKSTLRVTCESIPMQSRAQFSLHYTCQKIVVRGGGIHDNDSVHSVALLRAAKTSAEIEAFM